jgi:hypothetical protein
MSQIRLSMKAFGENSYFQAVRHTDAPSENGGNTNRGQRVYRPG